MNADDFEKLPTTDGRGVVWLPRADVDKARARGATLKVEVQLPPPPAGARGWLSEQQAVQTLRGAAKVSEDDAVRQLRTTNVRSADAVFGRAYDRADVEALGRRLGSAKR